MLSAGFIFSKIFTSQICTKPFFLPIKFAFPPNGEQRHIKIFEVVNWFKPVSK